MGLDIVLGIMILLGGVRGWYRGFVLQAIRLAGLVGSVYLAAPVRGLARPHVAPYLATIRPDLLDRMLWWAAVVVCYLVTVGLASTLVHMQRRRPYGDPDISRADQLAGFLLAGAKTALILAFSVASLDRNAGAWIKSVSWADEQSRDSMALAWERQYRPADRIWASAPVQQFVGYVKTMGISGGVDLGQPANLLTGQILPQLAPAPVPTAASAEVAPRNPRLGLPNPDATVDEVAEQISQAVEGLNHP